MITSTIPHNACASPLTDTSLSASLSLLLDDERLGREASSTPNESKHHQRLPPNGHAPTRAETRPTQRQKKCEKKRLLREKKASFAVEERKKVRRQKRERGNKDDDEARSD